MQTTTQTVLNETDMKILETAVKCRNAGAARYLWAEHVERLVEIGYLLPKNEHAATITDAGLAAFVRGY